MTDEPLDALFRCEHWACTLAVKHCLRRQQEQDAHPARKYAKAMHAYCGTGDCAQGNEIAAKHPEFQIVRANRKAAPRLDIVQAAEEKTMPKGVRSEPCKDCGSRGTRHKMGCTANGKKAATPAARLETIERAARNVKRERRATKAGLDEMSVAELLDLRAQVQEELERREEELSGQLAAIRGKRAEAA